MTAAQIAEMVETSEVEIGAAAYEGAARGDGAWALRMAVADVLTLEARLAEALRSVSHGYVRGSLIMPARFGHREAGLARPVDMTGGVAADPI